MAENQYTIQSIHKTAPPVPAILKSASDTRSDSSTNYILHPTRPAINWYRRPTRTPKKILITVFDTIWYRHIRCNAAITLSGVWRGALDCCAKKTSSTVDGFSWFLRFSAPETSHPRPTLTVQVSHLTCTVSNTAHYFSPVSSNLGYAGTWTRAGLCPRLLYLLWKYQWRPRTRRSL